MGISHVKTHIFPRDRWPHEKVNSPIPTNKNRPKTIPSNHKKSRGHRSISFARYHNRHNGIPLFFIKEKNREIFRLPNTCVNRVLTYPTVLLRSGNLTIVLLDTLYDLYNPYSRILKCGQILLPGYI